jgi:CAAX protease family protein
METEHKITVKPFLFSVAVLAGIESVASAFTIHNDIGKWVLLGATRCAEIIVFILVLRFLGSGLKAVGLERRDLGEGFKNGLIWSGGFGAAVCIGFGLLLLFGIDPLPMFQMPVPGRQPALGLFFLVGGVIAPVCEEIFFRGILYGFFRRWGCVAAVLLSTLIFTGAHGIGGRFPVTQAVGGVLFALAYEFGGSLMVPITVHVLGNLTIFAIALWL